MSRLRFNKNKFVEFVLYVADKCFFHEKFGVTKLNKILFFADFLAYANFGKPITAAEYFNLERGPAPQQMKPILDEMQEKGEIEIVRTRFFTKTQHRPIAKRAADIRSFKSHEIALIDQVIEDLKDMTAQEVSNYSHQYVGWKMTEERELIPYHTVFCKDTHEDEITDEDRKIATEIELAISST